MHCDGKLSSKFNDSLHLLCIVVIPNRNGGGMGRNLWHNEDLRACPILGELDPHYGQESHQILSSEHHQTKMTKKTTRKFCFF